MAFSLVSGPVFSEQVIISCTIEGSIERLEFTISGTFPLRDEYNRMVDILRGFNAKGCSKMRSLKKINYDTFPCPIENLFGCRKNDPIIYDNCLLDELKGIINSSYFFKLFIFNIKYSRSERYEQIDYISIR